MKVISLLFVYIQYVFLITSIDPVQSVSPPTTNKFDEARKKIMTLGSTIEYKDFCSVIITSGADKIACRIRDHPSVAFLVCKKANYPENGENIACKTVIKNEQKSLLQLRGANINVVTALTEISHNISHVKR